VHGLIDQSQSRELPRDLDRDEVENKAVEKKEANKKTSKKKTDSQRKSINPQVPESPRTGVD
jgi:hypothetical protein